MQIIAVDTAAGQLLRELHELECSAGPVDRPYRPLPTLTETTVDWTLGYCGAALDGLQAREDDQLAGYAWISMPVADNTANADVAIVVRPELRRRGIGTALAHAAAGRVRAHGRTTAIGTVRTDSPGAGFAAALGAAQQHGRLRSVLCLDSVDRVALAAGLADARARAAGYSLMPMAGPVPADRLEAVAAMFGVVNDAPQESAALEDESWTAGRVGAEDQWRAARGELVCTILAWCDASGQPAGLTRLAVRATGDLALQLETAVAREHRGRRLGYLLKASMLGWLADAAPRVRRISTFNAAGNEHMIAVNAALGFVPEERRTFCELAV